MKSQLRKNEDEVLNKIKNISTTNIKDGDILVVKLKSHLPTDAITSIRENFTTLSKRLNVNIEIIILPCDMDIEIITQEIQNKKLDESRKLQYSLNKRLKEKRDKELGLK